jgi:anti-sigma regulatory factor (Ser/Thr protein kinase)
MTVNPYRSDRPARTRTPHLARVSGVPSHHEPAPAELPGLPGDRHRSAQSPARGWIDMPGVPEQVGGVRRELRRLLGADHPVLAEAELLTTETVTNAIRHTVSGEPGGRVMVRISIADRLLRIETADQGCRDVMPSPRGGLMAEDGRGLVLVAALATRHGYRHDTLGGVYWFELTWD